MVAGGTAIHMPRMQSDAPASVSSLNSDAATETAGVRSLQLNVSGVHLKRSQRHWARRPERLPW